MLEKPVEPFEQLVTTFNALFDAYLEASRLQSLYETRLTRGHEATKKAADVRAAILYAVRLLHGDAPDAVFPVLTQTAGQVPEKAGCE